MVKYFKVIPDQRIPNSFFFLKSEGDTTIVVCPELFVRIYDGYTLEIAKDELQFEKVRETAFNKDLFLFTSYNSYSYVHKDDFNDAVKSVENIVYFSLPEQEVLAVKEE